jgi:hypothetical protein
MPTVAQGRRAPSQASLKVPPGWVGLLSDNPQMQLVVRLNDEAPQISDGLGGWDITDRPQQIAMTTWKGNAPFSLSLSVLLDGFQANQHVESQIALLYDVARGLDSEPGTVQIRGIPGISSLADDWVITGIDVGDCIRRQSDRCRVRQELTLTLLEFNPPDWESVKKGALRGARGRHHLVTVRATRTKTDAKSRGESAAQLAKRLHIKWSALRDLNPKVVKTANRPLKIGTKLHAPLPAPSHRRRGSRERSEGR